MCYKKAFAGNASSIRSKKGCSSDELCPHPFPSHPPIASWPDFKTSRGRRHLAHLRVYIRKSSTWIIEKQAWLQRLRIRELDVRLFFSTFQVFAEELEKRQQKGKVTATERKNFLSQNIGTQCSCPAEHMCQGERACFWLFMQEFNTWFFLPCI